MPGPACRPADLRPIPNHDRTAPPTILERRAGQPLGLVAEHLPGVGPFRKSRGPGCRRRIFAPHLQLPGRAGLPADQRRQPFRRIPVRLAESGRRRKRHRTPRAPAALLYRRWGKYRARLRPYEQRFFRSDNWGVRHRWRLRPSLDFPLQGERLDPRETYLNAQIEWLTNIFEESPLYYRETRLYAGLGWQINEHYKLENGLEWRNRRSDAEGNRRHRLLYRLTLTFR
ncbi:MAG: DUF2490 domain-containing protein [Lewinellaceae bacterium]|nr:DUF2490 domain-containing protein [Lewinellaceae bacterium]